MNIIKLQPDIERIALKLTKNISEAEDLMQDTNLKILLKESYYKESGNLNNWVYTIMKNLYISKCRAKKQICEYSFNEESNDAHPDVLMQYDLVLKTLESLNPILKIPLQMYVDGYKYKEICEKLKLNINTTKLRIFRARKIIKEKTN